MTKKIDQIGPIWIDDTDNKAEDTIPIDFGVKNVAQVKFTITVKDSNAENAETDEGSDPDEITIKVTFGNLTFKQKMSTPATFTIQLPETGQAAEGSYLPGNGRIEIDANLNGGKAAYFFGRIVWVDQGCEYTINGECTYMSEELPM